MASRAPGRHGRPDRPSVQTNVPERYSFQETPMEMQQATFQPFSSPTNSTIEESPITPGSSHQPPSYDYEMRHPTPLPQEKATEARLSAPPTRQHPAFSAPLADSAPSPYPAHASPSTSAPQTSASTPHTRSTPRSTPATTYTASPPPPSVDPLPAKRAQHPDYSTANTTPAISSPTPQKFTFDRADTYAPTAEDINHRPGQVAHPNSTVKGPHWKHSLCEPDTDCCIGFLCPCVLYGKTMYRLSRRAERKDATDMLGYERCNGSCGLFAIACGMQGVLAAIHRTRIRKMYHIEGSLGSDCMKGCCCCCCVLAQNEREVKDRESVKRQVSGPINTSAAYASPSIGMHYAPPPR